jgi:hypothetical protein
VTAPGNTVDFVSRALLPEGEFAGLQPFLYA